MTNATGVIHKESDYYPFGGERVIASTLAPGNKYQFTGMERDAESGLDHTLYRQYTSNLGRWLSPDPLHGTPANPQSLNRYAYVLNNPINGTDPLGLFVFCPYGVTNNECNEPPDGQGNDAIGSLVGGDSSLCSYSSGLFNLGIGFCLGGGIAGRHGAGEKRDNKQQKIDKVVNALLKALASDPCCLAFLNSGGHDVLAYFQGIVNGLADIGHAPIPISGGIITHAQTPGIVVGQAVTINDNGAFFQSSVATPAGIQPLNVGGITGGTARARALILLHEAGHAMGVFGENNNDRNDPAKSAANDRAVQDHCQKTLSQFK